MRTYSDIAGEIARGERLDGGETLRSYPADPAYDAPAPAKVIALKVREPLPAYDDTAAFVERWSRRAKWVERLCYALLVLWVVCAYAGVMLWLRK